MGLASFPGKHFLPYAKFNYECNEEANMQIFFSLPCEVRTHYVPGRPTVLSINLCQVVGKIIIKIHTSNFVQ